MNPHFDEFCAAIVRARLTFIQSLNGIAMALAGGAVVVHEVYPDVVRQLLGKLPPEAAAAGLFVFGVVVHFGLRGAKKQVTP